MALLTHLTVKVSGVIPAPLDDVWKTVRVFGGVGRWLHPVHGLTDVKSQLLPGTAEGQVGGMRVVSIGLSSFVEQLECLDEEAMTLKWKLISHPLNTNPFPATFLNLKGCIQLMEVTREQSTFMVWTSDFDTDFEGLEAMRAEISARMETGFEGLTALLAPKPPTTLLHSLSMNKGAAPVIGSVAGVAAPVDRSGSPPAPVPTLARQLGPGKGLAGEIPELRHGQQELSMQQNQLPHFQPQPVSTAAAWPSALSAALQDCVPLGEVANGSFPGFRAGPSHFQNLPPQAFMDAAFLATLQQRKTDKTDSGMQLPKDNEGGDTSTEGGTPSDQADLRGLGQANEQLQKDLQQMDPQQISAYLAYNGNMVRPRKVAQDPLRAFIQQGFPPDTPSQGSLEGLYVRRSMEKRGDSAGSECMTAGMSPHISPHASPKASLASKGSRQPDRFVGALPPEA